MNESRPTPGTAPAPPATVILLTELLDRPLVNPRSGDYRIGRSHRQPARVRADEAADVS